MVKKTHDTLKVAYFFSINKHIRISFLHIFFFKKGKVDQGKHTLGKRHKTLIKTSPTRQDSFILATGVISSLIEYPILKGLGPHMFSDESKKLETFTYIYNTYVRTK